MTYTSFTRTMKQTVKGIARIRHKLLIGALAPIMALSLAACNGSVFSSLPGNNNLFNLLIASMLQVAQVPTTITSATNNGTYGIGTDISLTLNFGSPVTLSNGTMDVTLNSGKIVHIPPFGPSTSVNADFTIAEGESSSGVPLVVTNISTNGAKLVDASNHNAAIAIQPGNNILNSLTSAVRNIIVDGIRPVITSIISTSASGLYGSGVGIDITVNFSEKVSLSSGSLDITLNSINGAANVVSHITSIGGTNTRSATYTVALGDTTTGGDLIVTGIAMNGSGNILDDADNTMTVFPTFPFSQNIVNNSIDPKHIVIDGSSPSIISITSIKPDGRYGVGTSVNVTVNFSEAVDLSAGGVLDVTLDTGEVVSIAGPLNNVSSASSNYIVKAGQNSADLHATAIALTSGTLTKHGFANTVTTALPGDNFLTKDIIIDTTAPVISSVTSSTANGTYGNGIPVNVTVNFSEPVTLSGGPLNVTLDTGHAVSLSAVTYPSSVLTGTYTVAVGDSSADLNAVSPLSLTGTIIDTCDENPNTLTATTMAVPASQNLADNKAIVIDGVLPTVSRITSTTGNGSYGIGSAINVQVQFSKNVTLSGGTLDVTLGTGDVISFNTINNTNIANATYTVGSGDNSADLTATSIALSSGATLRDAVNNNAAVSLPSGQNMGDLKNIIIDTTAPTIASATSTTLTGTYGTGAVINVTVNFSEPVTLTGGGLNVTLNSTRGGTPVTVVIAPFGIASSTATATYTVVANDTSSGADLTVDGIALGSGATVTDNVTNTPNTMTDFSVPSGQNLANDADSHIKIDGVLPLISSINSSTPDGTYGSGSAIIVELNFSKPVTLAGGVLNVTLDTGDIITVSAGSYPATTLTGTYTVGSGDTSSDLTVTNIALGGAATLRDSVTNSPNNAVLMPLPSSNLANNRAFVIDGVLPAITSINSSTANGTYGNGAAITVTVNFNKAVTLAGAGTLDLTLDTGGVVSIASISGATTATGTYTVGAGQTSADLNVTGVALNGAATLRDSVPNNPNNANLALPASNLANNKAIVIDSVAPVITSITSTTADGRYGPGAVINVRLNFSKNVTLTGGSLDVTLDTGDVLSIPTISNATQANVNYTVGAGDTSTDLNVTGIALNSATLRDQVPNSPNNADLSLPANNLATGKALVIDSTPPTITSVTTTNSDGTYGTGGTINVTVNFSEPVKMTGTTTITLNSIQNNGGGAAQTITFTNSNISGSSASKTYTVLADDTTLLAHLTVTGISGGSISDVLTSNSNTLTDYSIPGGSNLADSSNIIINGVGASISSITTAKADGRYGEGQTMTIVVTFSAPVDLAGGNLDLTLDSGTTVSILPFANSSTASILYTIAAGQNSTDLHVTNAALSGGSLKTHSGTNDVNLSLPVNNFSTKNIIIDTTAPTIVSVNSSTANGTYGAGATVNVTVNFSEPVTLASGNLNVTLDTGAVVAIAPFTNASSASGTYTVTAGQSSADLNTTGIALSAGSLVDTSTPTHAMSSFAITGNNLATNKAIVIDGVAPVISSINSSDSDGTYGTGATVNVTVNFSKNVTLAGGNLNVTLDTGTVVAIAPFTNSATAIGTYTVTSGQSSADLNVTSIALGGGATLRDTIANNPNNASLILPVSNLANNKAIVIDAVVPTITSITSSTGNGTYGTGATVNVTVNFSKNVTLAGGTLDLTLNTGTVVHIAAITSSTASGTYTVTAGQSSSDLNVSSIALGGGATLRDTVPNNPNTVNIGLPANNLADNKAIVIDGVAPVISSISSSTTNGTYGIGANVDITVTFSKNVTLAGGTLDLTLDTGAVVQIAAFPDLLTASGTYNVASGQSSTDLNVSSIALNGATLRDTVPNNPNSANISLPVSNLANNKAIVIDGVAPTISSVTSMTSNGTYASGDNVNVTVYFSESVTLSSGTLDVTLNTGYTLHISPFSGTSASGTYTVQAGNTTSLLYLTATVIGTTGGTIRDGASNALSDYSIPATQNIGDLKSIIVDGVLPAITAAETMDVDHDGRIDYYKITFNKNVKDSTFPGYSANNLGTAQTDWLVAGHSSIVLAHGTAAPATDTINDNIIYLKFNEIASGYDTDSKPNLTTTLTPGLTDTVGSSGNAMAQVGTTSIVETDKAAPIIVSVTGATGSDIMAIAFSEPVDPNGSAGGCSLAIGTGAFTYSNDSGGGATGISSMVDNTACLDNNVTVQLNTALTLADITPTPDHVTAVVNGLRDMNDNAIYSSSSVAITGAISPYVLGVSATAARKIRITYSEAVDNSTGATGAMNLSNYTLIEDPTESGCAGSGSDTVALTGSVVEITPNQVFELTTNNDQCSTTTYRLTVANVIDQNDGVVVASPTYGTFLGNERLKVSSASCLTTTTMVVVFNKAVQDGTGTGGAAATNRYKFTGATSLGAISGATRGSGSNTNQVTLTHGTAQTGGAYTIIGSNAVNADGFDDVAFGAIQNAGLLESLQLSPRDRSPWTGCGTAVDQLDQGPISTDPFGDLSPFGYLAVYHGQVYVGPNTDGNGANRFNPDGTNPVNLFFEFNKDTSTANGTGTHSNTATTRDGSIAVPPYVTIGHSGCTNNSANVATGCGPDNENGRGLFVNGTIGGTEYLFITGGRSAGDNDYLYQTTDTDTTLNFSFVDLSATFDSDTISGNKGTESIVIFNNKVYWMEPGDKQYRPYFVKLNDLTAQSASGTNSQWMYLKYMPGMGSETTNGLRNYADRIGGLLYAFNNKLYIANNGSVTPQTCATGSTGATCSTNGGLVRSNGANATDPGRCTSSGTCNDWTNITPSSAKYTYYFGKIIAKLADAIPADKPVPAMAEYKTNLYMIRNACTTNMINRGCDPSGSNCSDDVACPAGNEVPQLWKCVPGTTAPAGDCDAGDWSLVAENGTTGKTNMGHANNTYITLLIRNGDYLYVGFDNTVTGLEIWRTNVASPTTAGQFEQIGGSGLSDPTRYLRNFSAVSMQQGTDYYLYVSAGDNTLPLAIFRQKNN